LNKIWTSPFGYFFKPLKANKGTAEYKAYFRFWNIVLGVVNISLVTHLVVNQGFDITKPFQSRDKLHYDIDRKVVKRLEKDREQQSEELLKLVEKANKPFQPFTTLPSLPPTVLKEEEEEYDFFTEDLKKGEAELLKLGLIERLDPPAQTPSSEKEEEKVPKNQNETS